MDYEKVYNMAFSQPTYSNEEHIQYKYVQDTIKQLALKTNNIIEIGSGRGQNLQKCLDNKSNIPNMTLTAVDLNNYHNLEIDKFIKCDLSIAEQRAIVQSSGPYDILICTDVFEHLNESFIEDVVAMCSGLASNSIIAIANHPDIQNGVELHTIQKDSSWWDTLLKKYFTIVEKSIHYDNMLYMYRLHN